MDPLTAFSGPNSTKELPPLEALGPPFQVFLALIYSLTAILAFILNFTAAVVLLIKKRSSADLRKYLINLSFADILMALFSIPFSYSDFMYGMYPIIECIKWICHRMYLMVRSLGISIDTLSDYPIHSSGVGLSCYLYSHSYWHWKVREISTFFQ